MTIGELKKELSKYPDDYNVQVTWESCVWPIYEDNIYQVPIENVVHRKHMKGLVFIDADGNDYKEDFMSGELT